MRDYQKPVFGVEHVDWLPAQVLSRVIRQTFIGRAFARGAGADGGWMVVQAVQFG
jgi:hypothetical protein